MVKKILLAVNIVLSLLISAFLYYLNKPELGIAVLPFAFTQFSFVALFKEIEEEKARSEPKKEIHKIKLITKSQHLD